MFVIKEGTPADQIGQNTPPEVLDSITKYLEKTGYIVRTSQQDKDFIANTTQAEVNKAFSERNTQLEQTVLETTGIQRQGNEKYYDYFKRAMTEKLGDVAILTAKIKDLEKNGSTALTQQMRIDLEKAQGQISTLNSEWQKKVDDIQNEVFTSKVDVEIERVISELQRTIDPTVKPELIPDIIAARIARFRTENQPFNMDGFITWKDPKTQQTKTSKQDAKPLGVKDVLTPYFQDIIGPPKQQGGAGSGNPPGPGGQGGQPPKYKEIVLPETVKTQVQLTDYLMKEAKLDPSSVDYSKAFEGLKGTMPLQ